MPNLVVIVALVVRYRGSERFVQFFLRLLTFGIIEISLAR